MGRCGGDTERLFGRCLPATWLWGQWRSVLVVPLVPRLHAGSRHRPRPRLAYRCGAWSKSAHCRGSEETSPRFVAVGRGGVSKPEPLDDGGCGALLTCLCAKLGRKGRKSKPQGEKCVTVNRFFCVSKCGVEQTRAEKQWSFSSKWWTFRRKWCTFSFYFPTFFEQRTCIGEKGRIKPRFIGENERSRVGRVMLQ